MAVDKNKPKQELSSTDFRKFKKQQLAFQLKCNLCPPNKGCNNVGRHPRPDRYKEKGK